MTKSHPDSTPVLAVRGLRPVPGGPVWDFGLSPGGSVFLEEAADSLSADTPKWLDLLLGLEFPAGGDSGEVLWRGRPWADLPPDEASSARGECGVVPAGGGLLTNLDMDENVWLPALWHRREDADSDIPAWAAFFGCAPLPQERIHAVPPGLRRRIAWTRAFAGHPALILLENAAEGASPEARHLLLDACIRKLSEGAAIVWIAPALDQDVAAALSPLSVTTIGNPVRPKSGKPEERQ